MGALCSTLPNNSALLPWNSSLTSLKKKKERHHSFVLGIFFLSNVFSFIFQFLSFQRFLSRLLSWNLPAHSAHSITLYGKRLFHARGDLKVHSLATPKDIGTLFFLKDSRTASKNCWKNILMQLSTWVPFGARNGRNIQDSLQFHY